MAVCTLPEKQSGGISVEMPPLVCWLVI